VLKISAGDRAAIVARVVAAASSLDRSGEITVSLPELEGTAVCSPGLLGIDRVEIKSGALLTNHIDEIETELFNVVALKRAQAIKNGWAYRPLLVIDLSRVGFAFGRSREVWAAVLEHRTNWAAVPFLGIVVTFSSLTSDGLQGACAMREDTSESERTQTEVVLGALGFGPLAPR
jgi:hypothetical protein